MKMTNGEEAGIPARLTKLDNDDTKLLINLLKKVTTTTTNNNQQKKTKGKRKEEERLNGVVRRVRGKKPMRCTVLSILLAQNKHHIPLG